jgi:AcrR family transcriptional regulator
MTDIAREMGVARPTLYRQVSSLQEAIALVTSRQLHLFVDELTAVLGRAAGPDTFIDAAVRTVTFARNHPVVLRIINDEPALIGELVTSGQLSSYAEQIVELVVPVFEGAMATGSIRVSDPRLAAGLIVRLVAAMLLLPAGADLERLVRFALEPILKPEPARRRGKTSR